MLTGKTAVVTGASSGIGEATARLLVREKCNVVLAARREDRLNSLAAELGEGALPVPTDVTDPAACEDLISRAVGGFGSVDILVANAGLGLYGSIAQGEPEDWRRMFEVNVLGVLYTTRAAVRHMLDRGSGDVIFVSSLAGRRVPRADGTVYAATKHALTAVAEGLRMDVHTKGIRVIRVEPGLVRTEFPENSYPNAREYYAQREYSPLEAEDVAEAVIYAVEQPPRVSVNEILVRPTEQAK
ncbi:MAG: SDR family oxidoreductase [Actinomycetota bacterium]|nr:SDR family oxidoreductase [Rubrobacteraceae bacterium]MDQ3496677.1 SDR family oxidoreductase [Actinomycetota bacterium]